MIFKSRRSDIIHNWTLTVVTVYKYVKKFAGRISCYMMESKDFISNISFKLKNENNEIVYFKRQSNHYFPIINQRNLILKNA